MKKKTRTTVSSTVNLTHREVHRMLVERGVVPGNVQVQITAQVPGGGDYSNVRLGLDEFDGGLQIDYTEVVKDVE